MKRLRAVLTCTVAGLSLSALPLANAQFEYLETFDEPLEPALFSVDLDPSFSYIVDSGFLSVSSVGSEMIDERALFKWLPELHGDFAVQIDFELTDCPYPTSGENKIPLRAYMGDPVTIIARVVGPGVFDVYKASASDVGLLAEAATTDAGGSLRMSRTGSTVSLSYKGTYDPDFQPLWTGERDIGPALVRFAVRRQDSETPIQIRIDNLHVVADGAGGDDCNSNGIPDFQDILDCDGSPWCSDCNGNGIPDECDVDLYDGLVGYWSFDENEGSIAYDSSPGGHNGTIYGATWTGGVSGSALQFDGIDNSVDVESMDIPGSFTVSAWARPASLNDDEFARQVFNSIGDLTQGDNVVLEQGNTNTWLARIWDRSADESVCIIEGPDAIPGRWYHLVYTFDAASGSARLFVDGLYLGDANWGGSLVGADSTPQIARHWLSPRYFHGTVDDVRVYDRALSASEVLALYRGSNDCNSNGIPDECDIASGFSLDCDGNGVPDECDGVIVSLLGCPDIELPVKLFGQDYTVYGFDVEDDEGGVTRIHLPFRDTDPNEPAEPVEANLETDAELAKLVFAKTWFYYHLGNPDLQNLLDDEITPIRNHYKLDTWWETTHIDVVIPGLKLFSKRKAVRHQIGHTSLWAIPETMKAMVTGGWSLVGTTIDALDRFDDLGRFDNVDPDQLRQEIQALILLEAVLGDDVDLTSDLMQRAGLDNEDFARTVEFMRKANMLEEVNEVRQSLMLARQTVGMGVQWHRHIGHAHGIIAQWTIGIAADLIAEAAEETLGWSTMDEQIEVAAALRDAHCDGISRCAENLLQIGNEIVPLEAVDAEDTPENRATLLDGYRQFITRYSHVLYPLLAEHFRVQRSHLVRVRANTNDFLAAYVGASQANIDDLEEQHDDARSIMMSAQDGCDQFGLQMATDPTGYECIRGLIAAQDTDTLLAVEPDAGTVVLLGQTTPITLHCANSYLSPLTVTNVGEGTARDGIHSDELMPGITIQPFESDTITVDVTVPIEWFLFNAEIDQQGDVELSLPITWTVDTNTFTKTFTVPITVVPTASFTSITPDKNFYRPGETVTLDVYFDGGDPNDVVVAKWLRPDGSPVAINWGTQEPGHVSLPFTPSGPPYGGYGVELFIATGDYDAIRIPVTIVNQLFYVVPETLGDPLSVDYPGTAIIFTDDTRGETDRPTAEEIQAVLGLPPEALFNTADYTLPELEAIAATRDTILIGGQDANPLVASLRAAGKIQSGVPGLDGDAYNEIVSDAFGTQKAVVVAGYRFSDTDTAAVGFLDAWPKPDCNNNGVSDFTDISSETSTDCNQNGVPDECDIADGTLTDLNGNGFPDECEGPGDLDLDMDVDWWDFVLFDQCLAGPGNGNPGVEPELFDRADITGDGDADLMDFATFQQAFGG